MERSSPKHPWAVSFSFADPSKATVNSFHGCPLGVSIVLMTYVRIFCSLMSLFTAGTVLAAGSEASPEPGGAGWELVEVRKIWHEAPHNAFTDLIRFKEHWYCVFREGTTHWASDGRLRVIRSSDGASWESVALFEGKRPNEDWREARFSVTPEGFLMLTGAITLKDDPERVRESVTLFSQDGNTWTGPHTDATSANTWRWSTTWHEGFGYSIAYSGKDKGGHLYRTPDGSSWESVVADFFPNSSDGNGNEAALYFLENGTAYCLLRRDSIKEDWTPNAPGASAQLGISQPPYTQWEWKDLGERIGGPILRRLKDGRFVTAVRLYSPRRTALLEVDPEAGTLTPLMNLPSEGDTSYAGLVEHDGMLWISYYSSPNEETSIYLAKVRIPPKQSTP